MENKTLQQNGSVVVSAPTALASITEGEISVQCATAHNFPRSLALFEKRASDMVSQDEETAASCLYSRPVGKDQRGKQKYAEGMSIRMAEIVGAAYGNLRVGAMLIEQTPRQVKARGFAHDLESNFASTSEVVEATVDRDGRPYSERMAVVVAKVALAKARRDAIFQVVPRALCKTLEDLARKTAIGDAATLSKRRGLVVEWIGKLGIPEARVFSAISVKGIEDVGLKELELLTGLKTAIKEGDSTIEEAFPPESQKPTVSLPTEKRKPGRPTSASKESEKPNGKPKESPPMDDSAWALAVGIALTKLHKHGLSADAIALELVKGGLNAEAGKAKPKERAEVLAKLYGLMGEVPE